LLLDEASEEEEDSDVPDLEEIEIKKGGGDQGGDESVDLSGLKGEVRSVPKGFRRVEIEIDSDENDEEDPFDQIDIQDLPDLPDTNQDQHTVSDM